jgi:oxygen-dependent protoporphyrinogen oxidase
VALSPATGEPIFSAVRGGYRQLVDELVRRARPQRVDTAVTALYRAEDGWDLYDAVGTTWHADTVVIAVPAVRLAPLLAPVAPVAADAARRIPVASSAVVALALPAGSALPEYSGVLVASGEALHAKAVTLSSRKWGRLDDVQLLRCSFGRYGDDVAATASDEQLRDWALEDISTVFGLGVEPVDWHVARWIDAMPQYAPGHGALVAEIRRDLPESLALAGNYLDGIGVPACIASGAAAAARVAGSVVAR